MGRRREPDDGSENIGKIFFFNTPLAGMVILTSGVESAHTWQEQKNKVNAGNLVEVFVNPDGQVNSYPAFDAPVPHFEETKITRDQAIATTVDYVITGFHLSTTTAIRSKPPQPAEPQRSERDRETEHPVPGTSGSRQHRLPERYRHFRWGKRDGDRFRPEPVKGRVGKRGIIPIVHPGNRIRS